MSNNSSLVINLPLEHFKDFLECHNSDKNLMIILKSINLQLGNVNLNYFATKLLSPPKDAKFLTFIIPHQKIINTVNETVDKGIEVIQLILENYHTDDIEVKLGVVDTAEVYVDSSIHGLYFLTLKKEQLRLFFSTYCFYYEFHI